MKNENTKNKLNTIRLLKAALAGGAVLGLLACGGCASIVSGTTQQIAFDSNPSKADVLVNGNKVGVTPCVAVMQRSKLTPRVEIKKEGYEDVNVPITSRFNYWVIGNIFWSYFSTTAFAVDLLSHGATVEYDPNRYFTMLEPIKGEDSGKGAKEMEKPKAAKESANTKEQSKVLRYIAVNYDQLVSDIARGTGEHLAALYDLLGVEKDKQVDALAKLKDFYVKYADIIEFARAVDISFPRSEGEAKP